VKSIVFCCSALLFAVLWRITVMCCAVSIPVLFVLSQCLLARCSTGTDYVGSRISLSERRWCA
jgi:hypothetical protein